MFEHHKSPAEFSRTNKQVHACPFCGCKHNPHQYQVRRWPKRKRCPNCKRQIIQFDRPKRYSNALKTSLPWLAAWVVVALSGCDQAVYDRGFKAGKEAGYETGRKIGYKAGHRAGYSSGRSKGKAQGFAAGTATFVSGTFIPNLGLILSIVILGTATSWLSVYYIVPRHRAKQAKYDAKHSIEKTRKQLKAKHQVTVRQEVKRLKANLKLEKHEQSFQSKLEKLFSDASLLLLTDSNRLVDELCNRQLKTIKEIASAGDLTTEERILLYPAAAADLKSPQPKDKSNVKK